MMWFSKTTNLIRTDANKVMIDSMFKKLDSNRNNK